MPIATPDKDRGSRPSPRRSQRQRPTVRRPAKPKPYKLPQSARTEAASGQGYPKRPATPPARKGYVDQRGRYTLPKQSTPRGDAGRRTTASQRAAIDRGVRDARVRAVRNARRPVITPSQLLNAITFGAASEGEARRRGAPGATTTFGSRGTVAGTLPLRAASNIGMAFAQEPADVSLNTARGFRDALTGIPAGIVAAIDDPEAALRQAAQDYSRRYGPLVSGNDAAFRRRIIAEGAAGELLDASTLAAGAGGVAGRAAGAAARAGNLGARAERLATEPRRAIRATGGKAVEQELSPNLIVAAGQKIRDERRARKQARKVARADAAERPVEALLREAVTQGELAPRQLPGRTSTAGRMYAGDKSRDLQRMKLEQAREVDQGARRAVGSLSKRERVAFKYAMQLGIKDAESAKVALKKRLDDIVSAREAKGTVIPAVRRKTNDEVQIIRALLDDPEKAFTEKLAAVVRGEQARDVRVARRDPGLDPVQAQLARHAAQAQHLGLERADGETPGQFLRRVKKAAAAEGLGRPGYFRSEKRPGGGYSERAIGGARAVADPKRRSGVLFETGREVSDPLIHEQAISRGIKRRYNWNLVSRTFNDHSFEWGRNQPLQKLLDVLDERGIDPGTVALWNPRRYRDEQGANAAGDADTERTGRGEEPSVQGLDKAVDESTLTLKQIADMPEAKRAEFLKSKGWSVVPKGLYDEVHADTRPSGMAGRTLDIAKGKQSRILLGLSPAWLQFQVASNALLTGLAGTGPVDFVKAQAWFAKLPEAQRDAIEPYIGTGSFQDSVQQTKLGAARSRVESINHMIDAWRAFKTTPFMQKIGRGNPLDLLFRLDAKQNDLFRRTVLYSEVKRDAYKRMGQDAKQLAGLQTRAIGAISLGPEQAMRMVIEDQRALERHAQKVNDFLGDYQTYTAKERRYLQRSVMFYGFLRFSIRFTFATMPIKHPVISSLVAQLGRMQTDEVRKLLGGDELPWALGKFYWNDDGTLKSVDVSRANPTTNALTNFRAPKDALGFLPPVFVAALDQTYAKTSFRQRDFRVEGENQGRRDEPYGAVNRARIYLDQMLNLAAPYRALEKATQSGPQGDDSLLWDPRPTRYKRADIVQSLREQEEARPDSLGGRLLPEVVPFVPRKDAAPEIAAAIRQRKGEKAPTKPTGSGGVDWGRAARGPAGKGQQVDWGKASGR